MPPSRPIRALCLSLSLLACAREQSSDGRCDQDTACQAGWICLSGECRKPCNSEKDCATGHSPCVEGLCEPAEACDVDSDCDQPGLCQRPAGTCRFGECTYAPQASATPCDDGDPCTPTSECTGTGACIGQPMTCDSPPDSICIDGDSTFRTYSTPGRCEAGTCEYTATDASCTDCTASCLATCDTLSCTPGPCLSALCAIGPPPTCVYQPISDGTPCTVSAGTSGVCQAGTCSANLALRKPVRTAGEEFNSGTQVRLTDGLVDRVGEYWAARGPNWAVIDLEGTHDIRRIHVNPFGKRSNGLYYYEGAWNVKYATEADPAVWLDFSGVAKERGAGTLEASGISITVGDPGDDVGDETYRFYELSVDPVPARYIRYDVTVGDIDNDTNGDEIAVY